eukprot:3050018-Alexandrium_andersonii.AAC.1
MFPRARRVARRSRQTTTPPGGPVGAEPQGRPPPPIEQCRYRRKARAAPAVPARPESPARRPGWPAGPRGPLGACLLYTSPSPRD